jgi:DNA-binding NtrC family response regulator
MAERIPFSYLKGLRVLAIADEEDVLKTIENVLTESQIDRAKDYAEASQKLGESKYGLAILGINGVNGTDLLVEAVNRGIPTIMLTNYAIEPETINESITRDGFYYFPKKEISRLREFLDEFLATFKNAGPKQLLKRKRNIFEKLFGQYWVPDEADYWARYFQ